MYGTVAVKNWPQICYTGSIDKAYDGKEDAILRGEQPTNFSNLVETWSVVAGLVCRVPSLMLEHTNLIDQMYIHFLHLLISAFWHVLEKIGTPTEQIGHSLSKRESWHNGNQTPSLIAGGLN